MTAKTLGKARAPPYSSARRPAGPAGASRPGAKRRVSAERCQSGRLGRSRKPLCGQPYRGFESHPLRHSVQRTVSVVLIATTYADFIWSKLAPRLQPPPINPLESFYSLG